MVDGGAVSLGVVHESEAARRSVVELLEQALKDAKEGRWEDIIILASRSDRWMLERRWSTTIGKDTLLGRLALLEHEVLRDMDPEP